MLETTVVVIGGGATGIGTLRDLCMRGVPAILLEQGGLAHGTSSRFHGLLHSGGRYAVSDTESARECIEENMIVRRIGRQCVEETEGFFALTPQDDPAYVDRWVEACGQAGIEAAELSVEEALRLEPNLSPKISRVFRVPDSCVDGFRLVLHNAMFRVDLPEYFPDIAQKYGACRLADAQEFLLDAVDNGDFSLAADGKASQLPDLRLIYHAPCHLRAQGNGLPGLELLRRLEGVTTENADAGCCGISGSYGFKKEKYDIAQEIGAELFARVRESGAQAAVSECGTCRVQIMFVIPKPLTQERLEELLMEHGLLEA